jgi:diaminopimelate epimerase
MGNPHAICFHGKITSHALDEIGPRLSGKLPGGSNVEIATVRSETEIDVDVWERGVGRTLACGTGAAATAVAAVLDGKSPYDTDIIVTLPGGPLSITVSRELDVNLRGPAAWVYRGVTTLR